MVKFVSRKNKVNIYNKTNTDHSLHSQFPIKTFFDKFYIIYFENHIKFHLLKKSEIEVYIVYNVIENILIYTIYKKLDS